MREWDNDKHEEVLERRKAEKRIELLQLNQIDLLVISLNDKENQYVFKRTIEVLKDGIRKFDYSKKTVNFYGFIIRFCTEYDYKRLHLSSLRAKEIYGRNLERRLDDYEKRDKELQNG